MYQDTISSFGIPSLTERYEFIRQLGNVFLVRPDVLKSYITENYLGRIDPILLKPYIALRSDYGQFEKGFIDGDDVTTELATEVKSSRFARLSVMMKDLEGIKLSEVSIPSMPSRSSLTGGFALPRAFG